MTRGCVHTIPLHDGWTIDETEHWIGQGLLLPDVDPPQWANVAYDDKGDCPICTGTPQEA